MRGKGEGAIYQRKSDGLWVGTIELRPVAGTRRRLTRARKDKAELIEVLADLRVKLAENGGDLPTAGVTVKDWFLYWLEHSTVRPNTLAGYRSLVTNHIIPTLGTVKLDQLTADDLRRLELDIKGKDRVPGQPEKGKLSPTYANAAHRVMAIGLKAAQVERVLVGNNIAALMKAPKKARPKRDVLSLEESIEVIGSLKEDPFASLWATFFLTGARRGEVIGLERDRVGEVLDLSWQLQRLIWSHGCDGNCGRKRGTDCPQKRLNVPADYEYRHITGGLFWTRPKSSAGWRIIPLEEPLRSILQTHLMNAPANEYGLVWTQASGWPLDPDQTTSDWEKRILPGAKIAKHVTVHDIRHSTIDLLYELDIPEDVIMEIVGHSVRGVTRGYKSRRSLERRSTAMKQLSALFTA